MKEYYKWEDIPEHLKTKTQLNEMGLRITKGQKPEAVKLKIWKRKIRDRYSLYNVAEASPKKKRAPLSEAQREILAAGRRKRLSCPKCGKFWGEVFRPREICMECAYKNRMTRVQQWAEGIVEAQAVFLDTETTGLDDFAEIVEIAIVDIEGKVLLNTLIKPTVPMGAEVMGIHGITNEMVSSAPSFADIWAELKPILENNTVCIYNASFDLRMIRQSWEAGGIKETYKIHHQTCAMELFAELYGEWSSYFGSYKWQSLGTAASHLDIEMPDAHRAHADAETTRRVVMKLAEVK
jgi:DNA polymerase-3 subunit epsilon